MMRVNEQMEVIRRKTVEIIPEEELWDKLRDARNSKRSLKVKLGCDPSRPDLHIGHSVVLRKLRQFQDLGHEVILVVGDFTGMIGDPSGRSATRPPLTLEETRENGRTYFEQATQILEPDRTRMVYNSEWLEKLNFEKVIRLASKYTVARMLERDEFEKRYKSGKSISIHEFLYPLAQAMDSVVLEADVELGGTDQTFNLLMTRDIQREYEQKPQVVVTTPLLVGTDGVEKMSKSLDNYIGITEPPREIYGKTMSIPDALIYSYFELATELSDAELSEIKRSLEDRRANPMEVKKRLARELVTMYHSREVALEAEREFDTVFRSGGLPDKIPEHRIPADVGPIWIVQLLRNTGFARTNGEARRLIVQGGVSIDGERVSDVNQEISLRGGEVLKVGKRRFARLVRAPRSKGAEV